MFYLKYRPKLISEIDNSRIKDIITKILSNKSLPHAFLFVGQKGTGKTSTGRILAKAVNCLGKKTGSVEPCNQCLNCQAIDSLSCPDVVELDAASNRGIEDIRSLIRESSFFPMNSRYRIFIIDEAHMITADAFNALLKTLEEPSPQVIFILATTNQEKIPKTISSRCFIVNFGKAKKTDIILMLKRIINNEKIKIDDRLIDFIASHCDHSFRDATKILEELVTQKKLTLEEGKQFLGIARENFLQILATTDLKNALAWIEKYSQAGGNFKILIELMLDELRLDLLAKKGLNLEEGAKSPFSQKEIIYLMRLLIQAYADLRISPIESLPLEIAVVEFYNQTNKNK